MNNLYSGEYYEVQNIKNILENENIEAILENELMSTIEPVAITSGGYSTVTIKVHDYDYEKALALINKYKKGELQTNEELEKESFLTKLAEEGYNLNLTLDDNCLYCSDTDTSYLINSFVIDKEMTFMIDGVKEIVRAVNSQEFNIKGYYIF